MKEKISISTKIILFVLATILIATPFYEFVPALDPDNFNDWHFISCCPNF